MKKIIIALISLFLLTGCDAVYNIEINNNSIKESTSFYFSEHDYNFEAKVLNENIKCYSNVDELIEDNIKKDYSAFNGELKDKFYYNKNIINEEKGINLSYKYKYDDFNNSSLLNKCSNNINYVNNKKYISINAELSKECFINDYGPYLDNLTINLKTHLKVLENNADEINNNVYTWNIKNKDINNKKINITILKDQRNILNNQLLLFTTILIISIILIIVIKKRK